jgi:gliding motility-associated-like protein
MTRIVTLFRTFMLMIALCCYSSGRAQVVINEYSCSNLTTFMDNFGGYEDWVELYNAGSTSVNLTGYHLSDKKTNVAKWTFGNVTIAAGGFLRVWCSGRNVTTGTLHTNFSLTQCKPEIIMFANAANTILDSMTLRRTQLGHSRGRTTNGAATWSVFQNPTPNASNNTATAYQDYATTPGMNQAPGFYPAAIMVTLSSPDPNVTIRYTTNGSTPTGTSAAYSTPINISATTVLRAKAFSSNTNIPASFTESNTYFIRPPHTVNVMSVFGDNIMTLMNGTQNTPQCGAEYFDSSGTFKTEGYGQANKHGNDSWFYAQRGIDFICRDEYGYNDALKHQIFNMKTRTEFQHIILKAAANDNYPFEGTPNSNFPGEFGGAHIRDQYVHTVSQKAGLHLDERTWAPLILYVNGQYWGVYDIREKVDDKDFVDYYHNTKEDSLQMLKTWGGTWSEYGGAQAQTDWNNFVNFVNSNNMTIPANYNYVDGVYSIKSLADYVILNSYCVTSDWLNWNTAWWRGLNVNASKKKWRYILWDEDATFNHYINYTGIPNTDPNADPCDPESLGDPGGQGHVPILNALMTNPTFKQYYVMRYFDLLNGPLSCTRMLAIYDSMINVITPEMPGQIARWGGTMTQWQSNVTDLRNFIQERCDTLTQLFNSCYNVTGPYTIKVNVDPPGSGTVDINSLKLTSFVWQGLYPGNLPITLLETPNPNYCFSHWTFKNHTPLPNSTSPTVSVTLNQTDSIVAHFVYNGVPVVTPSNPQICAGQTVTLTASQGQNFTWSPSTGLSCTSCTSTVASPSVTTTYTVVASNMSGCTNMNTVVVTIAPPPPPIINPPGAQLCPGESVTLVGLNGGNYVWAPATGLSCTSCSSTIASPVNNTTYTLTSNPVPGCSSTNTVNITIVPAAIAAFSNANQGTTLPTQVQFVSTSSLSTGCAWDFGNGLTSTSCTPTVTYNTPGTYTVTLVASGQNGCNDTITKVILISDTAGLIMPTVFTPNGDGINDYFQPISKNVSQFSCSIYDRWGRIVYDFKSTNDKWTGQSTGGGTCPDGTYYYILEAKDDNGKEYKDKGFITLNR